MAFKRTPIERRKGRIPFILATYLITGLYTIHAAVDSANFSDMVVSQRGRSIIFIIKQPRTWRLVATSTAAQVAMSILGNGILLYRCFVICRTFHPWIVTVPAALIYLASIVTSILYLVSQASLEGYSRLGGMTGNTTWGTAWFLLSVAVNIFVTTSISYNLINEQKRLARALSKESVRIYTGIVAILLESALPFSVLGIAAGVVKAVGHEVSALNEAWFAFCALSPQLIIFRVMTGRAWLTSLESSPTDAVLSQQIIFAKGSSEVRTNDTSTILGHDTRRILS
ncbi:hypothetical protein MD484_g5177, partial [Candolleomyces efflorescens]